jgi:Cytochrome C biogenesis protein transmembrane region
VTLASILALGFLLGMRHATDADHLAAVATLATRSRSLAHTVAQGIAWGTGHTLTLMFFGGAVLVLGAVVPAQAAQALELAVGVMLCLLGADALYRLRRERIHFHAHRHTDGVAHFHAHSHSGEGAPHDPARHEHVHPRGFPGRALLVGMVHGMAGSAALILLSLEALRSPVWGFAYIAIFGLGSILGMALLSAAIAVPLRLTSRHLTRAYDGLSTAVGVATVMLGCYIVYQVGIGGGVVG